VSGPTSIEWTDATWNPVRGCSRISPGCENCYAEKIAARFSDPGMWGHGYADRGPRGGRWTRRVSLLGQDALELPMRWREPRRVFVNSTSDLFHEGLTNEEIAAVFGVMAQTPRHTYQVLTKRARRMREWFEWIDNFERVFGPPPAEVATIEAVNRGAEIDQVVRPWPLPNVWIGVSAEDQQRANERIPELLRVPAAVRFVSYEPALGPVDFADIPDPEDARAILKPLCGLRWVSTGRGMFLRPASKGPTIDWIIVGGESGPGARPFDVAWARSVIAQCRDAGVACFMKQLGAQPVDGDAHPDLHRIPNGFTNVPHRLRLKSTKGGDPIEWPADLRVREWPIARAARATETA